MTMLLRYTMTDGQITGVWTASSDALLAAQIVEDDPISGYLLTTEAIDPGIVQERYGLIAGVVTAKQERVLSADVPTFAADGVTMCTVSIVPFIACSVQVNGGTPVALSEADPTLEITADLPGRFVITLVRMAGTWAEPVMVEAV